MEIKTFTSLESTFLSKFNEGFRTFELLKDNVPFNEKTLNNIIETLISKNIIKFDLENKQYIYDSPVNGEIIIIDGNIMLPTTMIKTKEKLLISRGLWYEFPLDFDCRRIIWNVQLPHNSKSTLVELIQQSVLKERKSKIIQLEEYQHLVDKLVPWSKNIKLKINTVGEDVTDVSIMFIERLEFENSDDFVEFREFSIRSEISTEQLINELRLTGEERDFQRILLNRIFNFSDFIFAGNGIPYLNDSESINYVKITAIRGRFELTYFRFNNSGKTEKLNVEEYTDASEGLDKLKELFSGYAQNLLLTNNFLIEVSE